MKEEHDQRSARRAMSAWLTTQINNVAKPDGNTATPHPIATPAIRECVLSALQKIDTDIAQLNRSLQDKYCLAPNRDLVKFYMKGGNAFECVRNPTGAEAKQYGGGTSDWDTQIIVDPWAPVPLQAIIYGLLEELVMNTMIEAGAEIASVAGEFVKETGNRWTDERTTLDGGKCSAYTLQYDDPQSLRRVFDQQRLGLWTNDQRRISDPNMSTQEQKRIPGILLNDAIRPFILHRLGYTWHAKLDQHEPPVRQENVGDIRKPVLMELIDVTLPRRDTIEAVTVWEELAQGLIEIEKYDVGVKMPDGTNPSHEPVKLPLPNIMYHLREIATMLCEIADGSSHHQDKLAKRFTRFKLIWDNGDASQWQDIIHALSAMAGASDGEMAKVIDRHTPFPKPNSTVTEKIKDHVKDEKQKEDILGNKDPAYRLARNLMDRIADSAASQEGCFDRKGHVSLTLPIRFDKERAQLRRWFDDAIKRLPPAVAAGILEAAFSDDLVLIGFLEQNEYLSPSKIGFSGVFQAMMIRVATKVQVDVLLALFQTLLDSGSAGAQNARRKNSVRFRVYSVPRATGVTHESTMVVFNGGKAIAYLSVTTATRGEAPFRRDPVDPDLDYASLPEIAAQRKVAAALIEDYLVRQAISRQYEALKTLLPVI